MSRDHECEWADEIIINIPEYVDEPSKFCGICEEAFAVNELILERVLCNESGFLDMWLTEYVHLRCMGGLPS